MKKLYLGFPKLLFFVICLQLSLVSSLNAQQLNRSSFVIFGVNGVQFSSSNAISGPGSVGSNILVKSGNGLAFPGDINSGGKIDLGNSNTVAGKTTAANSATLSGNILLSGSSASFAGDIIVNGALNISGASVASTVKIYQPAGAAYVGPSSAIKAVLTNQLPILPVMPTNTSITPNTVKINTTTSKGPGTYGDVVLSGNNTLTLTGPGTYIFNSFSFNKTNQIIFDFGGTSSGKFYIYVKGTMLLDKVGAGFIGLPATQTNKDAAARIYTEVQGVVATGVNSFEIANGSSPTKSKWLGTVWASGGNINLGAGTGNTDYTGALWSGKQVIINSGVTTVYAPLLLECGTTTADAGQSLNPNVPCTGLTPSVQLQGSSTGISNPTYSWTTTNGNIVSGQNTATPIVTTAGTYVLVVSNSSGCSATAQVKVTSCVDLAVDGNPFKVTTKVDAILTTLLADPSFINTPYLFTFDPNDHSRILIEAILQNNTLATASAALALLNSNGFSQTSISNNAVYYIITGFFPIANLANLENPTLFNEIRAVVPPIGLAETGGLYRTGGDSAIGTRSARAGYDITGAQYKAKDGTTKNIKIGVISDSYNNKGGAVNDVSTGELPPDVELPNGDFPFGGDKTDEGRAMLELLYEQAPGAKLAFRTGFISEGDMAEGIRQLKNAGCNIIVDDITYATTPFFRDGLVTKAVKEIVKDSVLYFTSAGNFSNKAYEGKFSASLANGAAVPIPGVVAPQNNTLQRIQVSRAGTYMIILQWDDFFYSVNEPGVIRGADYDLDVYLTDYTGKNILGYNRINTGSDPLEILPFTVDDATTVYLKIVKASGPTGSANISYKYILFRGSGTILDNANANPSTIIGHANSLEAMTVGAVQYNLTPAYGVAANLVKVEPFSSWGGPTNGVDNKKPDFSAPDGVNTSVYLGDRPLTDINGNVYVDPDTKPGLVYNNFFGTSAAAPHAAGLAALLLEARLKYNPTKPAFGYKTLRNVFKSTALNVNDASDDGTGFDYKSGSGLLDAYKALLTEANPKPIVTSIQSVTTIPGGQVKINVVVDGNYLVTTTYLTINGVQVPTTVDLATKTLTAIIDPFTGNPEVRVCSPSIATGDGQCSNAINLLDPARTKITVRAKPYTKKYGTPYPPDPNALPFQYEILIGNSTTAYDPSQPLPGGLTLIDLGLAKPGLQPGDPVISTVNLTTTATNASNAGQAQVIHPSVVGWESTIPLDFSKLYNYDFQDGVLTIERLKVNITPVSQTITYGAEVGPVQFTYTTPGTSNVDPTILQDIQTEHNRWIANGYALVKGFDATQLANTNLAMMITETGLFNATSGATRANGGITRANVVDVSPDALNYFLQNRILTNGGVTRANGIPYDNAATRANGGVTRANGGITRANTIVNADALINGFIVVSSNGGVTRANVSGGDPNANGGVTRANGGVTRANYITFTGANGGVTRANVVLNSDVNRTAYPFAELSTGSGNATIVNAIPNSGIENGVLTNGSGNITLVNSSLFSATSNSNVAVLVDDADVNNGYVTGYVSINMVTGLTATNGTPHLIIPGAFLPLNPNYDITYGTGNLTVNDAPLTIAANSVSKKYGEPVDFTNTVTGYVYNPETDILDNNTIVFPAGIGSSVSQVINNVVVPFTGPIYPVGSYSIQPTFAQATNYGIGTPTNAVLTITKADQIITWANPAAISYGTLLSATQLNATVSGVTGGSAPGTITYTPVLGTKLATGVQTLKADVAATVNYNAAPTKSVTITVNKADLSVQMGQSIYYFTKGGTVPSISSTITGLAAGDVVSNNTYITSGGVVVSSSLPAGIYSITRNINSTNLTNFSSYNIVTNQAATLYVNPSGSTCDDIDVYKVCVDKLSTPVNGFSYRARFTYKSANTNSVYVPLGTENRIITSTGAMYSGNPPELFQPGTGTFYIYFNGKMITWSITSLEGTKKVTETGSASSSLGSCSGTGLQANNLAMESNVDIVIREAIYPNPATNQVFIEGDFNKVSEKEIMVVDGIGRQVKPAALLKLSPRRMQINISNLGSSQYYIIVNTTSGKKVYKFIKL